ncbi:Kinesin-like protein kif18b [Saguinus oedipus]|uniref:Kinesin-like protein kif18b n=1 Tax=Saguinus oedipus TaxID=9490 RepID=A0ABQ9UMA2_SAGOE|nr:Kinesin-like protein kif18b [Saguinus oedipus]
MPSFSTIPAICSQTFEKQQDWVPGLTQAAQVATISLIDQVDAKLAFGTQEKREQQQEGANINRSLSALINIHNALADAKAKQHRPASTSG